MTWRGYFIALLLATAVAAVLSVTRPYWASMMRSEDSPRGRLARKEKAEDSIERADRRGVFGGGMGLVCGLLVFRAGNGRGQR